MIGNIMWDILTGPIFSAVLSAVVVAIAAKGMKYLHGMYTDIESLDTEEIIYSDVDLREVDSMI